MTDQLRSRETVLARVDDALRTVPPAARLSATGRLAVMYAEAIDDDDEGDGLFRFGSRLRTTLETLGLALLARSLQLPPPLVGRRLADLSLSDPRSRSVSLLRAADPGALAA